VINMSGTGVRIVAGTSLPLDRMIGLEFGEHLLVASVRNFQKHGDKYAIGASRIHLVNKLDLDDENTSVEQVWEKMEESRRESCAAPENASREHAEREAMEVQCAGLDSLAEEIEASDNLPDPSAEGLCTEIFEDDPESESGRPALSVDPILSWPANPADGPAEAPEFAFAGSGVTPVGNLTTAHAIDLPRGPNTLRSGLPSWFKSLAR
jgi:hypothetical protein